MTFFGLIKRLIRMNDLFYSTEMLRFDKELEYKTITGGILSLGIIIAVIAGFASMILDTLSLNSISFTQTITKDISRPYSQLTTKRGSNFMLAVQLWQVDMKAPVQYFSIVMILLNTTGGQSSYSYNLIGFESCTRDHWSDFPQIAEQYDKLSMSNWLCPPKNTIFPFSGDYTSNLYQYVNISVNPCMSWLNPSKPCANSSQIQELFLAHNDAIRFKVYYTNPLINPGKKNYKSYYLESENFIQFGPTIGGQAYIYASDYTISTDESIWPYPFTKIDQGVLIEDKLVIHPYSTQKSTYAAYYLVKSPTTYSYQRTVQKISNVFSFMGGLISAVSASLFILKLYNNFAFEISVAFCIFEPPNDSKISTANLAMNFWLFLKVSIFHLLKKIGKIPDWPDTSFIIECQNQITNQLDVKALVKRVIFIQYCLTNLFEDYQLQGLQLQKPKSPNQIRTIRQKCESLDTNEASEKISDEFNSENKSDNIIIQNESPMEIIQKRELKNAEVFQKQIGDKTHCFWNKNKIYNLNDIQTDKQQHPAATPNIVIDVSERQVRISRNLSILKQNAQEGNLLSKKIWNHLQSNPIKFSRFKHRDGQILQ